MDKLPKTELLGVGVTCAALPDILNIVREYTRGDEKCTILYANIHSINTAVNDIAYRDIIDAADVVVCDGAGVVWGSRVLGGCDLVKITAADWIYPFCEFAQEEEIEIYFVGGKAGIAKRAREQLNSRYRDLTISGACDGYFEEMSEEELLQDIGAKKPQVVFVGMGIPKQEKWIRNHRTEIDAQVCWSVGAMFDYIANTESRVPRWMYNLSLEWLWRLLLDPRGKWKRYLIGNPWFVYRILREKYSNH